METLLGFGVLGMHASELITSSSSPLSIRASPLHNLRRISRRSPRVSVSRSSLSGSELAGDDVMLMFLEERKLHGDFISRISDIIWRRDVSNSGYVKPAVMEESIQPFEESKDEDLGGFLKLTKTQEWVSGNDVAPFNKKMDAKQWQNDCERTKRINLLKYEAVLESRKTIGSARECLGLYLLKGEDSPERRVLQAMSELKRELLLLTMGIGTACTGYCLLTLSIEAAVSYAAGVLFSCLYLQLLYQHTDSVSKDAIPQIFMQKKSKRIGIRSDDLKNALERTVNGSIIALSSPRLVIPAAIYGSWVLFHHFPNINFDFQLVPAMFGMFAYKAACLVQVYRDNEDLIFEFPQNEDGIDN